MTRTCPCRLKEISVPQIINRRSFSRGSITPASLDFPFPALYPVAAFFPPGFVAFHLCLNNRFSYEAPLRVEGALFRGKGSMNRDVKLYDLKREGFCVLARGDERYATCWREL